MFAKRVMLLLLAVNLLAHNQEDQNNSACPIDLIHSFTSNSVETISKYLDDSLSNMLPDANETIKESSPLQKELQDLDFLHQNEKYRDDTRDSFVQLRLSSFFESLGKEELKGSLRASVALTKTNKRINLFIESIQKENFLQQFQENYTQNDGRPTIGLNYFSPSYYSIESKYSLGLHGLEPYIQARFKTEFLLENWVIEPNQYFRFKLYDAEFEERSSLYFDTKLSNKRFFRIYFSRGTRSKQKGFDYGASLIYTYVPRKKSSLALWQSFAGHSEYTYIKDGQLQHYNKINSYKTQVSWRQNIWKQWFYYEIIPALSFDKKYNFQKNYQISFLVDFYFGGLD